VGSEYLDIKWDFRGANTKTYTHCFHSYPAIMIPQVAAELIDRFGKRAKLLFDPYCGSGTSLVEANLRGIHAIGTDLNPLARLLSVVKTTALPIDLLDESIASFANDVFRRTFSSSLGDAVSIPAFKNIDFWFDRDVKLRLACVRDFIESIRHSGIRNFFKVAFSETVREVSWTRNGEFKLFRMSEKNRTLHRPDVFSIMEGKLHKCRKGLIGFLRDRRGNPSTLVCDFNTVEVIPVTLIRPGSVDIVVTSPPYGDSHTTVAYGQFSRLSSQWLGFENADRIDTLLMGGKRLKGRVPFGIEPLDQAISDIIVRDSKRAEEVVSFYNDYSKSVEHVASTLVEGGAVCYVVGNRRVKGVTLPTDQITRQLFERLGFNHTETVIRNIPNKRMPSKNSPSNVVGQLDSTMVNEYIVVLQKTSGRVPVN
jgi:site-specific DNA-methyltransferase (cytosine-N4-specific)